MNSIYESIYYNTEKEPWKWVEDFLADYVVDESLAVSYTHLDVYKRQGYKRRYKSLISHRSLYDSG